MIATGTMTTAILPAAGATTLVVGPMAVLVFAGLAAAAAVLAAGVIAELRRGRRVPRVRLAPVAHVA